MKQLNVDSPKKRYALVKNSVIYDINTSSTSDACQVEITSANCPHFSVTTKVTDGNSQTTSTKTYYLDNLIEDGDIYEGRNVQKDHSW